MNNYVTDIQINMIKKHYAGERVFFNKDNSYVYFTTARLLCKIPLNDNLVDITKFNEFLEFTKLTDYFMQPEINYQNYIPVNISKNIVLSCKLNRKKTNVRIFKINNDYIGIIDKDFKLVQQKNFTVFTDNSTSSKSPKMLIFSTSNDITDFNAYYAVLLPIKLSDIMINQAKSLL